MKEHHYKSTILWTGNTGVGTKDYRSYNRSYTINASGKPEISGSSDPAFRGDSTCYSPEDLLLASISSCHMLWYLHLCSAAGVIINGYEDNAEATMIETDDGGGYFTEVILKPLITLNSKAMQTKADELHYEANKLCFIANSVKFLISHLAVYKLQM